MIATIHKKVAVIFLIRFGRAVASYRHTVVRPYHRKAAHTRLYVEFVLIAKRRAMTIAHLFSPLQFSIVKFSLEG